jgi:hypothetical protein
MTSTPPQGWRAQTPSPGFAERAVDAILRDRHARRDRGAGRWVLIAAVATVLIAGGAWGWTTFPQRVRLRPAEASSASALAPPAALPDAGRQVIAPP